MKITSSPHARTDKPTPQRSCVACRQIKNKRDMVRLFRTQEGKVEIDISGKKEGRGAYLCRDWACWETALEGKQLEYALKLKIDHENLERIVKDGKKLLKELSIG